MNNWAILSTVRLACMILRAKLTEKDSDAILSSAKFFCKGLRLVPSLVMFKQRI